MLEHDRINLSQGIDVNDTNVSKKCDIWHYWYFLDKRFKFEPYVCNRCHNLMQKAISFNDVAINSVKGRDYRIQFWYMSKDDDLSIMKKSDLNEKVNYNFFFSCLDIIKIEYLLLKEINKDYQNKQNIAMKISKKDSKQIRNKYKELPNEEQIKSRDYGRNRYQNV